MKSLTEFNVFSHFYVPIAEFAEFLCGLTGKYPNLQSLYVPLRTNSDDEADFPNALSRLAVVEPVAVDSVEIDCMLLHSDTHDFGLQDIMLQLISVFHVATSIKFDLFRSIASFSRTLKEYELARLISAYLTTRKCQPQSRSTLTILMPQYATRYHVSVFSRVFPSVAIYNGTECVTVTGDAVHIRHVIGPVVVEAIEQTSAHIHSVKCFYRVQDEFVHCSEVDAYHIVIDVSQGQNEFCVDLVLI